MHYHLEVIMPPTDNVEKAVDQILEVFSEEYKDEEGHPSLHPFYDWYEIGGRWSGYKLKVMLGTDKMKEFNALLVKEKITIGAFIAGKETLQPASQIPKVNKMWNDFFPESPVKECPIFDNYREDYGDIMLVSELPKDLTASRVIIASHHWDDNTKFKAKFMLSSDIWNGCNYEDTKWDGKIKKVLSKYTKTLKGTSEDFINRNKVQDDWICVTVDYHS